MVQKTLDLMFGMPIIGFCASERTLYFEKMSFLNSSENEQNSNWLEFALDKTNWVVYTNCSKVLHKDIAPEARYLKTEKLGSG